MHSNCLFNPSPINIILSIIIRLFSIIIVYVLSVSSASVCNIDNDCIGGGICDKFEGCICSAGRFGSNCQQKIFDIGTTYNTNLDGTKRCFNTVKPIPITTYYSEIRICFNNWESQLLASEVFLIITKELIGWPTRAYYFKDNTENAHDNLDVLANGECHIFLEGWLENVHYAKGMERHVFQNSSQKVLFFPDVGYEGRNGWYINSKSIRKNFPTDVYAAFKKMNVLQDMIASPFNSTKYLQNCSGNQDLCDTVSGTYKNSICQAAVPCGKLYASRTNYAKNLIQRQIKALGLNLEVEWLGYNGLKNAVRSHLDSDTPFLFYWWMPDPFIIENNDKVSRVKLPSYDSSIFKTTGGCDFPLDALGKFVSATLPSVVTNFVEKFKIKPSLINALLSLNRKSGGENKWNTACRTLKESANLESFLTIIPGKQDEKNTVRLAFRPKDHSGTILANVLQQLIQQTLGMNAILIPSNNDMEGRWKVANRHADMYVGMKYMPGHNLITENEFLQFFNFNLGFQSQLGLYLYVPTSLPVKATSINHYLYAAELRKWLPPLGTYDSDNAASCVLWWCLDSNVTNSTNKYNDGGHFVPTWCNKQNNESLCGEILISDGVTDLPAWSIVAEMIQNLQLPFALVFVNKTTLSSALNNNGKYVILYLSKQDIDMTDELFRFQLPGFKSSCISSATPTSYSYNNRYLGSYNCDFPIQNVYITAGKRIWQKPEALHLLLERFQIPSYELKKMIQAFITDTQNNTAEILASTWIGKNYHTWTPWIAGCEKTPGYFGIRGKCKPCPSGTYSTVGSNVCRLCHENSYSLANGSSTCISCPDNTATIIEGANRVKDCVCTQGIGHAQMGCSVCPERGVCFMGNVYAPNGYWRHQNYTNEIFKCPYFPSCLGVSIDTLWSSNIGNGNRVEMCYENFDGNLCNKCKDGYGKAISGICEKCSSNASVWISVTVLLAFIMLFVLYRGSRGPRVHRKEIEGYLDELRTAIEADTACVYVCESINDKKTTAHFLAQSNNTKEGSFKKLKLGMEIDSRSKRKRSTVVNFTTLKRIEKVRKTYFDRKLDMNDYYEVQSVVDLQIPDQIVNRERLIHYQKFFHQETGEVLVFPLLSDLQVTVGFLIFRRHTSKKAKGYFRTKILVAEFLQKHADMLSSQSQDIPAILFKILFSHLQIFALSKFLLVPWSGTSLSTFEFAWDLSTLFGM